ncbi:hypothetical protein [Salidesulfovibrio onnuriiensis]|uniref:hypothetical protein n=1 Tax=Salidesulfovibrio onnuriiensis TaxID=2583823 RepID=UPI0011C93791|nr:hypothetical protein [Salidesulfovibrio onnuriiensis]
MTEEHNIAIAGLGRIGTLFLEQVLESDCGLNVVCVLEVKDTPGRQLAEEKGIKVVDLDGLIQIGVGVDVVFDMTGSGSFRSKMQNKYEESFNSYTAIASPAIARLVWSFLSDEYLPSIHSSKHQAMVDSMLEQARAGILK